PVTGVASILANVAGPLQDDRAPFSSSAMANSVEALADEAEQRGLSVRGASHPLLGNRVPAFADGVLAPTVVLFVPAFVLCPGRLASASAWGLIGEASQSGLIVCVDDGVDEGVALGVVIKAVFAEIGGSSGVVSDSLGEAAVEALDHAVG